MDMVGEGVERSYQTIQLQLVLYFIWSHEDTFQGKEVCLFKLISDSKREGVFFISGDVHFGEIARYNCAAGYPLYDITSSGLTQAVEKAVYPPLRFVVRFLAWLMPAIMRVKDRSCRYISCTYGQPNFGTIEINWESDPVGLKFEVRDEKGLPVIASNISLSELQGQKWIPE